MNKLIALIALYVMTICASAQTQIFYEWKDNDDVEYIKRIPIFKVSNDVFSDSDVKKNSSELLFAVEDDLFMLLSEATFVGGVEIVPVPRNEAFRTEGNTEVGTQVSKEELVNFILEKVSELSDEVNITTGTFNENTNLNTGN